jgi:hypothetical protein
VTSFSAFLEAFLIVTVENILPFVFGQNEVVRVKKSIYPFRRDIDFSGACVLVGSNWKPAQPGPTSNKMPILIVSARPKFETTDADSDPPYRTITKGLFNAIQGKLPIEVHILRPGTWNAFTLHLKKTEANYDVVHFDIYGDVQ